MTTRRILTFFFALSLAAASFAAEHAADGARPRVAIAGFSNQTGNDAFETPAETATESLILTLRMLGSYEIVVASGLPAKADDRALLSWCDDHACDYLLLGEIAKEGAESQLYSLSVFDRSRRETTIRKTATGTSIFDVFSASDALTLAVIDGMTGRHIGFGSVSFEAKGRLDGIEVRIDGIPVKDSLSTIDRVVEGEHALKIIQKGANGEIELMSEKITVIEGAVTVLTVTIEQTVNGNPDSAESADLSDASKVLVLIQGGTFTMGDDREKESRPAHEVTVSDFWMGAAEVTQEDFESLMRFKGMTPSATNPKQPVTIYNWMLAVQYCNARSELEGKTQAYSIKGGKVSLNRDATGYRLPTEAEWEYAAKGGRHKDPFAYPGGEKPDETCWTAENAGTQTIRTVATKKPNSIGLYDMGGNVYEWCWDAYGKYQEGPQVNPEGAAINGLRVIRGGDARHESDKARCAARDSSPIEQRGGTSGNGQSGVDKNIGFRVVRPADKIADAPTQTRRAR